MHDKISDYAAKTRNDGLLARLAGILRDGPHTDRRESLPKLRSDLGYVGDPIQIFCLPVG